MESFDVENAYAVLKQLAVKKKCKELLQNYHGMYVKLLLRQKRRLVSSKKMDYNLLAAKALQSLQASSNAVSQVLCLAKDMDKKFFQEIVLGGYMMACGRSKRDGALAFYMRSIEANNEIWKLSPASRKGKAYIGTCNKNSCRCAVRRDTHISSLSNRTSSNSRCAWVYDFLHICSTSGLLLVLLDVYRCKHKLSER